jgi:DNA-binding SARP family transcriptional activator
MMRALTFFRSLLMLMLVGGVVPIALIAVGEWRFGGGSPVHGVAGPNRWSAGGLRALFAEPLTDRTLAETAIRIALIVAWAAVLVFIVTVAAEMAHMVRHGGHHLPDVRGLRWSQHGARAVAAGLLALIPMLTQGSPAIAGGSPELLVRSGPVVRAIPLALEGNRPAVLTPAAPISPVASDYVVRAGDSVFGIASQLAGPDQHAVAAYAERILDLNLGREMGGGEHFTNPGLIDVGWVLQLPSADTDSNSSTTPSGLRHTVLAGESLWSIADDELGDPTLWPELFAVNAGREFDDGRALDDPALLRPGWDLIVPGEAPDELAPDLQELPAPASTSVDTEHDAHHVTVIAMPERDAMPEPADERAPVDEPSVSARPENVWASHDSIEAASAQPDTGTSDDDTSPELLTMRRAVMLAGGVLTLLAVRRRRRLREAPPRARLPEPAPRVESVERELRNVVVSGERVVRVDLATRAATMPLVASGQRLLALMAATDGTIEVVASGPAVLPAMWRGEGDRWILPSSVPLEAIAADARQVNAPCPALVQLGVDDAGRDVYVDLEALGVLEIGGPSAHRDSIVAAIAATLSGSVLAEVTTLVSVGVPVDAFLGHRLHTAAIDADEAYAIAQRSIGAMSAMEQPPFELRARGTAGETWDPAVVLVGSSAGTLRPPREQPGLAVVSASPVEGPSSTLCPDGDAWVLRPLGVRLQPVGLVPDDLSAISELVNVVPAVGELDVDCTIYATDDDCDDHSSEPRSDGGPMTDAGWELMVRLFGSVEVVDRDGRKVSFERSKTTELVAWLATHRDRSTRANARTALWEQDVRDATFANVVSEARRAMARLVSPPAGEEWVGRTLTEALPLHARVTTDADVLARALSESRGQVPKRAIALLRGPVESIAGLPFEAASYLWPDGEGITSNLILLATSAAAELAVHCLAVGDTEGVFEATARGLRVLPGHEELIGLRMRAHARAGDHAAVRQEWSSYQRVVNADPWSDGEPSPKLVDLRKELLHPGV